MEMKSINIGLKIDTDKLYEAQSKVLELSELIQKAKSLADDLAKNGLDIDLEVDI